jgi:DNA-binding MarR family transcriptional regulator
LGERQLAELRNALDSMALVSGLHRACGSIRQHLERALLDEADLHWSPFATLWCLWLDGELETRHLADKTGVAKSTLSGILNMLEKRELVRRRVNEAERRLVLVDLTEAGAERLRALVPKCSSEEAHIASGLTTDQLRAATLAMRVILATIRQLDAQTQQRSR